MLEKKQITYRY